MISDLIVSDISTIYLLCRPLTLQVKSFTYFLLNFSTFASPANRPSHPMSANHLSSCSPTDEGNTPSPRPKELNNAVPNPSPSHYTMVVDLPQRPLQVYLPNHPLPMSKTTTSNPESNPPSSKLRFDALESRAQPSDTPSSPSVVRILLSSHPIPLRV